MAEVLWYYAKNDRQLGPVTPAELKQLASTGGLMPEDLIWREGMDGWAPAAKVKGLFAEPREPAPPAPISNAPTETMPPTAVAAIVNAVANEVPPPPPSTPASGVPADVFAAAPPAPTPEVRVPVKTTPESDIMEKPSGLAVVDMLWVAQLILWAVCIAIVLLGGLLFTRSFIKANSPAEEAAAGAVFTTFFIGAYVVARAGERVAALLQAFFDRRRK